MSEDDADPGSPLAIMAATKPEAVPDLSGEIDLRGEVGLEKAAPAGSAALRDAALKFAGEGVPVFPVNPLTGKGMVPADKDGSGAVIKNTGGAAKALCYPQQIKAWWKRWPNAMIGCATGHDRLFVLRFFPHVDNAGTKFTDLAALCAGLDAQMECALPLSRTVHEPDGIIQVWLRWADDGGAPVRSNGQLPPHIRVCGRGSHVIAPPSFTEAGWRWAWRKGNGADFPIADAPPALMKILRCAAKDGETALPLKPLLTGKPGMGGPGTKKAVAGAATGGGGALPRKPVPLRLGEDCPIIPLGVNGKEYYFLDAMRQKVSFVTKLDEGELTKLFGKHIGWLDNAFPSYGRNGDPMPLKFDQRHAQRAAFISCQDAGRFNPAGAFKGLGSHRGDDGSLILHLGDKLLISPPAHPESGEARRPYFEMPGKLGKKIFPLEDSIAHPSDHNLPVADAWTLLIDHLDSWRWMGGSRVSLDDGFTQCNIQAYMTFGFVCEARVCGALPHRPHLWIVGPTGAGKTDLHQTLKASIHQDWCVIGEGDATTSFIKQRLGQNHLCVLYDEPGENQQTDLYLKQLLTLSKLGYDGKGSGRGGADGKPTETPIYAAMQFGSVALPNMLPEERNRMVVVEVEAFPKVDQAALIDGKVKPYVMPKFVAEQGAMLTRRMAETWHRFDATLSAYQSLMLALGWSPREANTYGTNLACADLALFDSLPRLLSEGGDGRIEHLIECVAPMRDASREEGEDHPQLCVAHLAGVHLPSSGGQPQETTAQWMVRACVEAALDPLAMGKRLAWRKLDSHGMRLTNLIDGHAGPDGKGQSGYTRHLTDYSQSYVAVGHRKNPALLTLFKGNQFGDGGWFGALGRLKHERFGEDGRSLGLRLAVKGKKLAIGAAHQAAVLVPIEAFIRLEDMKDAIQEEKDRRAGSSDSKD